LLDRLVGGARAALGEEPSVLAPDELEGPLSPQVVASVVGGDPHVEVTTIGGVHRLDIYDRDRLGLFADTAGLLAARGLVVRTAVLRTVDGIAANEWQVEAPGGDPPDGAELARGLWRLSRGDHAPLQVLDRRRGPSPAPGPTPSSRATSGSPGQTRAMVVPQASADTTVIEVRAQDRPGLLHDIGVAFARAGLSVRSAHIATYAGQTLDTFYLTEFAGRQLPPARVAQAVSAVIDACDGVGPAGR
jgi:[protein-PII] uridylyltransferase